jgi:hypothetical protein
MGSTLSYYIGCTTEQACLDCKDNADEGSDRCGNCLIFNQE